MNISNNWTKISDTGAVVQKLGDTPASIAYSVASPASGNSFALVHNGAVVYPTVTGKALWAKAGKGSVSMSVEPLV